MVATNTLQFADYAAYLAQHPEESGYLIASFLINVSEFFRDPAFYTALRERVLPELIAYARTQGNVLRIWSAGCATGEERYSLAILVAEALADELSQFAVQIFATDLDEDALAFVRRGVYPASTLRLRWLACQRTYRRAFTLLVDGSYEIAPGIRALVTFGPHDLGRRAPFPRINLVLCRNILIYFYFTLELQRRALQFFTFALREGGYLALRKAETASPLAPYFAPTDERLKLHRRGGERILPPIARVKAVSAHGAIDAHAARRRVAGGSDPASASEPPAQQSRAGATDSGMLPISERLGCIVMEARVGAVVIDQHYDIQIINAEAIRLLGIYAPTTGQDLLHVTQGIPIAPVRAVLDATLHPAAHSASLSTDTSADTTTVIAQALYGEQRHARITCYPYLPTRDKLASADLAPAPDLALLLVSDVTELVQRQQADAEATARACADEILARTSGQADVEQRYLRQVEENTRLRGQVEELSALNHTLRTAYQQLVEKLVETDANLRSANEDLLVGREETEAGAEEIKTLNEEMQATNEELVTVNEELEATVEELHTANEDLTARSSELQRLAASLEQQHQASELARAQLEAILLSMGDAFIPSIPSGSFDDRACRRASAGASARTN